MLLHRTGNTTVGRRCRPHKIRVQRRVVRGELGCVVRVSGGQRVGHIGRHASGQNGPVVADEEHLVGGGDRATGVVDVGGVRAGCGAIGGPAQRAARHWPAAEGRGRRAGSVGRPAGDGPVRVRTGRLPRRPIRLGRTAVVLAGPGQLDVHGVLRVPARRPIVHAHVRADRLVHRHPVPSHKRDDRAETRGGRRIPASEEDEQRDGLSPASRAPAHTEVVTREMRGRCHRVHHRHTDNVRKRLQHE